MIGVLVFGIVFAIGFYAFGRERNPYIRAHKKKWRTQKDYEDYIDWLNKNGGDLPIKEVKFKEDMEVLNSINKIFKT